MFALISLMNFLIKKPSGMFVLISSMSFLIPPTAYPARCGTLVTTLLVNILS